MKSYSYLLRACKVQGRVINAVMMREVHTINGNDRLGYFWVLFQACFGTAIFWIIRTFFHFQAPHGMSTAMFLASGFCVWHIFTDGVTRCIGAERANHALLTFPQVTLVDVMIARLIVLWGTQLLACGIIIALSLALGYNGGDVDWGSLFAVVLVVPLFTLGAGMTLSSMVIMVPGLDKAVPMVFRIMFFLSGVFFTFDKFPAKWREILWLNPVAHLIEWARASLSRTYVSNSYDPAYVLAFTLILLTAGLLLQRFTSKFAAKTT